MHTPGPWDVNWIGPRYSVNQSVDYGNKHIAMVSCFESRAEEDAENRANARLIAAAPDLLEALELCYKSMMLGCADVDAQAAYRAAIAKAKGE